MQGQQPVDIAKRAMQAAKLQGFDVLILDTAGRTTLPQWAIRSGHGISPAADSATGPAVSTAFPMGWYLQDYDYLGDRGYTQGTDFDLDECNGRTGVTPEFPKGTYHYYATDTYPYLQRCVKGRL